MPNLAPLDARHTLGFLWSTAIRAEALRGKYLCRPVELVLGNAQRASMGCGFGPPRAVPARVAEDPAGINNKRLPRRAEIDVPAMLPIQHLREGISENLGVWLLGLELDKRPQFRLPSGSIARSRAADFPGHETDSVKFRPDANTLRDQRSLNHELLPEVASYPAEAMPGARMLWCQHLNRHNRHRVLADPQLAPRFILPATSGAGNKQVRARRPSGGPGAGRGRVAL